MTETFFRGRRERYRIGSNIDLVIREGARNELASQMMVDGIHPALQGIVDRCNDASSWGGYYGMEGDQVSRIYVAGGGESNERGRRLMQAADGAVS